MSSIGYHATGKVAFRSSSLRGLIEYMRKHGVTNVQLGDSVLKDGLYSVRFDNGALSSGRFADPSVMLGFFLGRGQISVIECDRGVFNRGTSFGRLRIPFLLNIGRDGEVTIGPWHFKAYRDHYGTPMVRCTRS